LPPCCAECLQAGVASRLMHAASLLAGQPTLTPRQLAICCQRLLKAVAGNGGAGWAKPTGGANASLQVHSAAAARYAPAKLLQLCRSDLCHVVQAMVRPKEFCTEHKPRHRCTTHPYKAQVVAVLTPAGR
jgi:hypothetical protein